MFTIIQIIEQYRVKIVSFNFLLMRNYYNSPLYFLYNICIKQKLMKRILIVSAAIAAVLVLV